MEMNIIQTYNNALIACIIVLAVLILVAIIRSFIGPSTSDRLIAVNMIGTLTIVLIAILTIYTAEDYLADVSLIYAMISFVAVIVLTKVYIGIHLEKKGIVDGLEAINSNLSSQPNLRSDDKNDSLQVQKEEE